MFVRISPKSGRLTYTIFDLQDVDPSIDFCEVFGETPQPPYTQQYGEFWFTEKGWNEVGIQIQELLQKHNVDYHLLIAAELETCYVDDFQVATLPQ